VQEMEHAFELYFTTDNAACVLSAACRHPRVERSLKYFVLVEPAKKPPWSEIWDDGAGVLRGNSGALLEDIFVLYAGKEAIGLQTSSSYGY
jgi:hypothetical protein